MNSGETPAAGRMILSRIRLKTDKPVRYIILTHYHGDHTWGLQSFPESAVVIGQENLLRNMKEITAEEMKGYSAFIEGLRKNISSKIVRRKAATSSLMAMTLNVAAAPTRRSRIREPRLR